MTLLAQPVAVDHPESWGPDFNRCGADNANAVVSIVIPGSTFAVPDGADAQQMQQAIGTACPGAEIMTLNDNAADLVAQYVHQGWHVIAQVHCDSQANPIPNGPVDHWMTVYGDSDPAPWFQCWTNQFLTMTLAYLRSVSHENDLHFHVLVRLPGAAPAANTQPATSGQLTTESDMSNTAEVPSWNGADHIFLVDDNGVLTHDWYAGPGNGTKGPNREWATENLATGLSADAGITATVAADNSRLIVEVFKHPGVIFRAVQFAGQGAWTTEDV